MKTVIEMANEAGLEKVSSGWRAWTKDLAQFAELVRADERELCAKVCEKAITSIWEYSPEDVKQIGTNVCNNLAASIRARSNT